MRNNLPHPTSSGAPVHLRLNLLLHHHSGKLKRQLDGAGLPARPAKPATPGELLSEGALDRGRLTNLLKGDPAAAVDTGADPDIEVTLVLYL